MCIVRRWKLLTMVNGRMSVFIKQTGYGRHREKEREYICISLATYLDQKLYMHIYLLVEINFRIICHPPVLNSLQSQYQNDTE